MGIIILLCYSLIRLELCHKLVQYYTELDYVVLYGTTSQEEDTEKSMVDSQCLVYGKYLLITVSGLW